MLRSAALACLGLTSLAGCAATREYFIPRENVRAQSPRGWPAAQYTMTIAGQGVGEAKVWSEGTFLAEDAGGEHTVLHIGFEVENRSGGELDFDVDKCRVVDVQGDVGPLGEMGAKDESGKLHVAAGKVGLIDLEYVLPRGAPPTALDSFRVEWTLANASGTFAQSTPFRVDNSRYYYPAPYYYGYGYGYYGPWWGFGTGFAMGSVWWGGWHHHHHCW